MRSLSYKIVICLAVSIVSSYLITKIRFNSLDAFLYNLHFNLKKETIPKNDILLLAIDNKTLKEFKNNWPIKLKAINQVINFILSCNPKIIAFAIDFNKITSTKVSGHAFNKIYTKNKDKVIICLSDNEDREHVATPPLYIKFNEGKRCCNVVTVDRYTFPKDGVTRRQARNIPESSLYTIPSEIALKSGIVKNYQEIPFVFYINYYGKKNTFEHISFSDVYNNKIPKNFFKNKIIIFQETTDGTSVNFVLTPFDNYPFSFTKLEIHATALQNIIDKNYIFKASDVTTYLYTIVFAFLSIFIVLQLHPLTSFMLLIFLSIFSYLSSFVSLTIFNTWILSSYSLIVIILSYYFLIPYRLIQQIRKTNLMQRRREKEQEQAKFQAMQKTTQMFAHDVRKPFTKFLALLNIIEGYNVKPSIKKNLLKFSADVKKSLEKVNEMLHDVLQLGTQVKRAQEVISPKQVIFNSLHDSHMVLKNLGLNFSYTFNCNSNLSGEGSKVNRIINNIVQNAIEAIKGKGHIWFKVDETLESNKKFLKFTIGNEKSFIPKEDQKKIFDAFYTQEKKLGTGLGLAIAKKFTEEHGGKIWLNSDKTIGTEFFFTLPATNEKAPEKKYNFPKWSKEFYDYIESQYIKNESGITSKQSEEDLEKNVNTFLNKKNKKVKLLIVDDEELYQELVKEQIAQMEYINSNIETLFASNCDETYKIVEEKNPDIIIIDVDLGVNSQNGFEIVEALRAKGNDSKICIHSNRGALEYSEEAIKRGANLYMPKPINKNHLLRLIASSLNI